VENQNDLQVEKMFTRTGPNAVHNSDGFTVMIAKRFELHYVDQVGAVIVPVEPMTNGELVVSVSTIAGVGNERIKERISAALNFLGIQHRFD
jgi:hypothetical protein